jgi:hypothetical protein
MAKTAKQLTPRQVAARRNGSLGGKARAKNLSSDEIKALSALGGRQTHARYGDDYFGFIAGKRKRVGRYSTPVTAEA